MRRDLVLIESKTAQFRPFSDSWLMGESVGEKKVAKTGKNYDIRTRPKVDQGFSSCVTSQ